MRGLVRCWLLVGLVGCGGAAKEGDDPTTTPTGSTVTSTTDTTGTTGTTDTTPGGEPDQVPPLACPTFPQQVDCISESVDTNSFGGAPSGSQWTFDGCGRVTEQSFYTGGSLFGRTTLTYDPVSNREAEWNTDAPIGGGIDLRSVFFYDEWGRSIGWDFEYPQAGESCHYTLEHDDGDAMWERMVADCFTGGFVATYTWDAATGWYTRVETDEFADGDVDRVETYRYDADVHLVEQVTDHLVDDTIDVTVTQTWAGGLLVERATDELSDGTIETTTTFTYDAAGRVVTTSTTAADYWTLSETDWTCPGTATTDTGPVPVRGAPGGAVPPVIALALREAGLPLPTP